MINEYFENNYNKILGVCKCYTSKFYEDLMHDVYIECKKSEHSIRDKTKIKAFINTIIKRQAIKYYNNKEICVDYVDLIYQGDSDVNIIDLKTIQTKLTKQEIKIITLLLEGYSQKEISEILELNYNTVRTKVSKIRNKLKDFK